jgi:hypothetical protein
VIPQRPDFLFLVLRPFSVKEQGEAFSEYAAIRGSAVFFAHFLGAQVIRNRHVAKDFQSVT